MIGISGGISSGKKLGSSKTPIKSALPKIALKRALLKLQHMFWFWFWF
jgi:hypothetical protein